MIILLLIGFIGYRKLSSNKAPTYQTATAQKGTLVKSVGASGNVASGNSVDIVTTATGVVQEVDTKEGDTISQGQQIAVLTLDLNSQQKQQAAWSSYLSAKSTLDTAQAKINSLQAAEFTANQKFIQDAVSKNLATDDPIYIEENANWLQAQADYQNQAAVITQAQTAVNAALLAYQQISPVILAPAAGKITSLNLTPGLAITSSANSSSSSSSSSSSNSLGTITMEGGQLQVKVNLSEIDSTSVDPGQKATITLDAFPDKTFTGHVLSIDTAGVVSSGVTTYPATISLETTTAHIYPNMAANAKIITSVKDNVLLVPSVAVQSLGGQTTVRILKNGKVQVVQVEAGDSNDTQTEITSGVAEGDEVVTGVINTGTSSQSSSPFGIGGRGGFGGGGGGAVRVIGGRGG